MACLKTQTFLIGFDQKLETRLVLSWSKTRNPRSTRELILGVVPR